VRRGADGTPYISRYGVHKEHTIQIRIAGWYRVGSYGVFAVYQDFWDSHFSSGLRFRVYPDVDEADPYDRVSAPYGYETWVGLAPDDDGAGQLVPGTYAHLTITLTLGEAA